MNHPNGNPMDAAHRAARATGTNGHDAVDPTADFVWLINNATKPEFDRVLRLARALSAKPYHVLANPGGVK